MRLDTKLIPKLVQEHYDLVKALYNYNPEGSYTYGRPAFCPFHDNTDTPAAALYKASDGAPDSLYCFAEQRQYTVSDVLSKLMGYNIYEVGHQLWNTMSEYEKKQFLQRHSKRDMIAQAFQSTTSVEKQQKKSTAKSLHQFKMGETTLNEALQTIMEEEQNK